MKTIAILFLVAAMLLTGCSREDLTEDVEGKAFAEQLSTPSNDSAAKNLEGEILFYPTHDADYKTGNNEMFDFWFDIPVDWNAVDKSADGSEYHIIASSDKVHIRIFGILTEEAGEDYYSRLAGTNGEASEFIFRDSWIGKMIEVSSNETYYVREDGDSYLVLHVDTSEDPAWLKGNRETIDHIAMSARTTRESHGKDSNETSSIDPDDLQVGDIDIDMSYGELIAAIGQEPLDVIEEQYDGMSTKTLFFPDDTQVYIVNDVVFTVNVTSPDYATPRGLKPGDSQERVLELYGEPDKNEDGVWGYCINGYELFIVVVEDGFVDQIQIEQGAWSTEVF
ncbi:MAG: hypothetical protein GX279_00080 [Clostridiaceae bacterium]|jgi:hypothetical protein|nr:hypothetical protein [Clostridiaceae bacterium]